MSRNRGRAVRSRTGQLATVAVAAALALTACSGGGGSTPGGSGDAIGEVSVIQSVGKDFSTGGVDFADANGLWPEGLTVTTQTGGAVAQALATGDVQIGVTSPTRVLGAIFQGLDVSIVGAGERLWDGQIVVSKDFAAKDVSGLKGARFGVTSFGSAGELSVREIAKAQGWADSDYEVVTLGDIAGLTAGLQSGSIDAFVWGGPVPFQLENQGAVKRLGFVSDIIGELPTSVVAVRNDFIASNPATVRAFCDGYYAGNAFIVDHPDEAAQQFVAWGEDPDAVPAAVEAYAPMMATDSGISDEAWQGMIEATQITTGGADYLDLAGIKKFYKPCDSL